MEMYLVKADEGYLRIPTEGAVELTAMDKASVFTDPSKCRDVLESLPQIPGATRLRMAKITITEEDDYSTLD